MMYSILTKYTVADQMLNSAAAIYFLANADIQWQWLGRLSLCALGMCMNRLVGCSV